jgi:hypothetical protein
MPRAALTPPWRHNRPYRARRHTSEQILRAIDEGTEEVYPDPISAHFGHHHDSAPEAVERAIAAMATATAA